MLTHAELERSPLLDLADNPFGKHAPCCRYRYLLELSDDPPGATSLSHYLALVVGKLVQFHELNRGVCVGLGADHRDESYAEVITLIVEDLGVQASIELGQDGLRCPKSACGLERIFASGGSDRLHEQWEAQLVRERMLDAELGHQFLLEVDHKSMGAAASYDFERVLVPVLDLVTERDEQLQVDADGIVGRRETFLGRPEGVPELRLTVDQDRVALLVLVAVIDLVSLELGLKQVQPRTHHGANEVAIVPG